MKVSIDCLLFGNLFDPNVKLCNMTQIIFQHSEFESFLFVLNVQRYFFSNLNLFLVLNVTCLASGYFSVLFLYLTVRQ